MDEPEPPTAPTGRTEAEPRHHQHRSPGRNTYCQGFVRRLQTESTAPNFDRTRSSTQGRKRQRGPRLGRLHPARSSTAAAVTGSSAPPSGNDVVAFGQLGRTTFTPACARATR
ncbi:hypothetical protein HBB16_13320 [Pseudonocardia sp. MCCB 268]|nr:hypothetical protein [Pseudonocardia cytotoxica]